MPNDDHINFSKGLQNLKILALGGCKLTGQIPIWLGKLRELQVLDLSVNQMTGSIPGWLGNLPRLFNIYLSNNLISGQFFEGTLQITGIGIKPRGLELSRVASLWNS